MSLRMVVFDVDGTLVDSAALIIHCLQNAFRVNECEEPQRSAVRSIIGMSLPEAVGKLAPTVLPSVKEKIVESYREIFFKKRASEPSVDPFFDGALGCIRDLNESGYLLGIATGKSRRGLVELLQRHNLSHEFVALGTADDGPGKPHPFMLQKVLQEAGVEPADAVVLGDTSFDMTMARTAGTFAVGVTWGNHEREVLLRHGAHELVNSYEQFITWVHETLPLEQP